MYPKNYMRLAIYTLICALTLTLAETTNGQTADLTGLKTASECLTAIQQYPAKLAAADRKAGQQPNYRTYQKQAKELGKQCAARFKLEDVSGPDLVPLARLYLVADQPVLAREAINLRLKTASLSEGERAEALVAAIGIVMSGTPTDESMKLGEEYTAKADALSDAQTKQKISAHSRMAGYYGYADMDAPGLAHQMAILKLIDQLPSEERKPYSGLKAGAYDRIALIEANRGHPEKAIETLQKAKVVVNGPETLAMFDQSIQRYSLVGQRVPPVKGTYWLNAASDTKELDPAGRVTLIQFTAHWCVPCRKSYPAMLKLYNQFGSRGLDVVMATELYGFFEDRDNLKPADELAADREYYLGHYNMPFKIVVEPRTNYSDRSPAAEAGRSETNSSKYRVGGIPQIMILDKQGIVRHILIGWDPANEELVSREIDRLLADEKSKK